MADRAILVVGGAGYIGTHMVKALLAAGHRVVILDNLSTGHRNLVVGGEFICGDLSDPIVLNQLFSRYAIDAVMHFAAFSLVGESVRNPLAYYRNNLAGTLSLLEAMVRHKVLRFIFSSTAAVYGEPTTVPITEDQPCAPTNPYGATKMAVERLLQDCEVAYGLKFMSLRYFNAAGADPAGLMGERHQPESHLIPLVLKTALGELPHIQIFGTAYPTPDGTCVRDYVHVCDLARAHLLALNALLDGGASTVYNLGNSKGHSVREVIELSRNITGRAIPAVETGNRAGDPAVLVAASDKIRRALGWHPEYESLETIIRTAWHWHSREHDATGG
ncbi:MAG: UDP-glucose 4-epimerase GalE [Desulfobacterales bacterium]|jgi:UDP-glucose 4-epimerase|nr:UDP-glucose 4-epimerase GalE [Desulfobacterales bacterium]